MTLEEQLKHFMKISVLIFILIIIAVWIWPKYNNSEKSIEYGFYNRGKRRKIFLKNHKKNDNQHLRHK